MVDMGSSLILGLELNRYANTNNMKRKRHITFRRPQDTDKRMFHPYIAKDEENNKRLRIEIEPHASSSSTTLKANIKKRPELNVAKKVQRFTQRDTTEMEEHFKGAGLMIGKTEMQLQR